MSSTKAASGTSAGAPTRSAGTSGTSTRATTGTSGTNARGAGHWAVEGDKLRRHGYSARFVHWTVALSTLALVVSGLGQLPLFRRYYVDTIPGLGWTSDFAVTLQLHYVAAAALTLAVVYHVVYHGAQRHFGILPRRGDLKESYQIIKAMLGRGEEPDSDKYLAEQRVAYAFIGGALLLVIATGYLKAVKNFAGVDLPYWALWTTTTLHNVAMVLILLGVVGHLAAFVFKENRALIPGMLHGKVDLHYAKERHCLWCEDMGIATADTTSERTKARRRHAGQTRDEEQAA